MKAAVLNGPNEPTFQTFREPRAESGQVVVKVSAAGVNPIDLILAKAHTATPGFQPIVPGREGIGTVDGRRVYFSSAVSEFGSMAEFSIAAEDRTFDVPKDISDANALSMGIAGLTAWTSLSHAAKLARGEHILVLGASGAVGKLCVQAARIMGAGRIVAAARSTSGIEQARRLGADDVVLLEEDADIVARFLAASGQRIDVIVDPIWGRFAIAALQAGSPGVRMVQIGNSAAVEAALSPAFMRMAQKKILGFSSSAVSSQERAQLFKLLCAYNISGQMKIDVETIPLSDVKQAWQRQASFPQKKLVLTI